MVSRQLHSTLRAVILVAALLPLACDRGNDPIGPASTVTATVTSAAAGAADGNFDQDELTGSAKLRCANIDFDDQDGSDTDHNAPRAEVFEFGDFALYVPASVRTTRALLLALGGPDTRGFITERPFGAPIPALEASLQLLGQELRTLASTCGLAVLGTRRAGLTNGPASDQLLLDAVQTASASSGHSELPIAPLLLYAISSGAPQASGFTARNPERVAGLFLKVPLAVSSVTSGEASQVPTYVVQAELDAFVNNAATTAAFEGNRAAGALWARAMERGVVHHSLSPLQRQVTINWMSTILALRLPTRHSAPLRVIRETRGWLGNLATGETARWAAYRGDRAVASWLPSKRTADDWEILVSAAPIP